MALDKGLGFRTSRTRALRRLRGSDAGDAVRRGREVRGENLRNALRPKITVGDQPGTSDNRGAATGLRKFLLGATFQRDPSDRERERLKREQTELREMFGEESGRAYNLGVAPVGINLRRTGSQLAEQVVGIPPGLVMLGSAIDHDARRLGRKLHLDKVQKVVAPTAGLIGGDETSAAIEALQEASRETPILGVDGGAMLPDYLENKAQGLAEGALVRPFQAGQMEGEGMLLDNIVRESLSEIRKDFTEPGREGYLIGDILGFGAGGYGAVSRLGSASRAGRAAPPGSRLQTFGRHLTRPPLETGYLIRPGGKFTETRQDPETGELFDVEVEGDPLVVPKPFSQSALWRDAVQKPRVGRINRTLERNAREGAPSRDPRYPVPETPRERIINRLERPIRRAQVAYDRRVGAEAVFEREYRARSRYARDADTALLAELAALTGRTGNERYQRGLGAAIQIIGDEGQNPETGRYHAFEAPDEHLQRRIAYHQERAGEASARKEAQARVDELKAALEDADEEDAALIRDELQAAREELRSIDDAGDDADHLNQVAAFKEAEPFLKKLAAEHEQFERTGVDPSNEYRIFRLTAELAKRRTGAYTRPRPGGGPPIVTRDSAEFREAAPSEIYGGRGLNETVPYGPLRPGPKHPDNVADEKKAEGQIAALEHIDAQIKEIEGQLGKQGEKMRPRTEQEVEGRLEVLRDELDELIRESFGDASQHALSKEERIEQMRRNRQNAMLTYAEQYEALLARGLSKKEARIEMGRKRDPRTLSGDRRRRYERVLRTKGELAALEDLGTRNLSGLAKARREGYLPTVKSELLAHLKRQFEDEMERGDFPTAVRYRELSEQIDDLERRLTTVRNRKRGRADDFNENATPEPEDLFKAPDELPPDPVEDAQVALAAERPVPRVPIEYRVRLKVPPSVKRYVDEADGYVDPSVQKLVAGEELRPDEADAAADWLELRGSKEGVGHAPRWMLQTAQRLRDEAASARGRSEQMEGYLNQPEPPLTIPDHMLDPEAAGRSIMDEAIRLGFDPNDPHVKEGGRMLAAVSEQIDALGKLTSPGFTDQLDSFVGEGDYAGAAALLERALAADPPENLRGRLDTLLRDVRALDDRPKPAPLASGKVPELHPDQATLGETMAAAAADATKKVMPRRLGRAELAEILGEVPEGTDPRLEATLAFLKGDRDRQLRRFERRRKKEPIEQAGLSTRPYNLMQEVLPRAEAVRRRQLVQAPLGREAASRKLEAALAQVGLTAKEARVRGVAGSAIPERDFGNAAYRRADGTITAWHVTDDPDRIQRTVAEGLPLDESRDRGKVGDLGTSGLYVSDVPQLWENRAMNRLAWIDQLDDDGRRALATALMDELIRMGENGYISGLEFSRASDAVDDMVKNHIEPPTLDDGTPLPTVSMRELMAGLEQQPYNLRVSEIGEKLGLAVTTKAHRVPVELRGTFVELDAGFDPRAIEAAKAAGFDGAFTKQGFSTVGQLVVWNNGAVRKVGDVEQTPIEKQPGTFYTGIFTSQAGGMGEYRPQPGQRKPKPAVSRHDSNAIHAVTDQTIKFGKRRLDTPNMTVELGYKAVRTLGALRTHDELWNVSTPVRQSEWDIAIVDKNRWPNELKDLERLGDRGLSVDPATIDGLTQAEMDAIVRHMHGAELLDDGAGIILETGEQIRLWKQASGDSPFGKWESAVPVGTDLSKHGVRWVDRRLVTSYAGGPGGTHVADYINNPLRTLYVYGRLAYVLNLPSNFGMQILHQGFAAPGMYQRALAAHTILDEEALSIANALVGEGKARATAVPTGPDPLASRALANWWSSWIDKHSRMSALFYEMDRYSPGILDNPELASAFLKANTDAREVVARRANKAMVEFNNLTDFEKNTLRHWIFLYPWMSRATVWAFRTALEHPAKMWAMTTLAQVAVERAKEGDDAWWDELPSYLRDRGFWKYGDSLVTFQGVNNFSTAAENAALLASLVMSPRKVYNRELREGVSPAVEGLIFALTGESSRGRVAEEGGSLGAAVSDITRSLPLPATFMQRAGVQVSDVVPGGAGKFGDFLFTPDEREPTKPYQGRVFDERDVDAAVGGFTLGGLFPRRFNQAVAAAKAERERRLNLTIRERVVEDLEKERTELQQGAELVGANFDDPAYTQAFTLKAARMLRYVEVAEARGIPLDGVDTMTRLWLDLQVLVEQGRLDQGSADQLWNHWSQQPKEKVSNFRTNLHQGIGGEGPLSGLRRSIKNVKAATG